MSLCVLPSLARLLLLLVREWVEFVEDVLCLYRVRCAVPWIYDAARHCSDQVEYCPVAIATPSLP